MCLNLNNVLILSPLNREGIIFVEHTLDFSNSLCYNTVSSFDKRAVLIIRER